MKVTETEKKRIPKNFRFRPKTISLLERESKRTHKTMTKLIEEAICHAFATK